MLKYFSPDLYINSIFELDLDLLKKKGIKGLLVDLDNTLLPWNSELIDDKLIDWIKTCKQHGFALCIISNNKARRIESCAKKLNIKAVTGSLKPAKKAFLKALKILNLSPNEVAVVGDQLFTDVFGAKKMGIYAILVKPLSNTELLWTKWMRRLERLILKRLNYPDI